MPNARRNKSKTAANSIEILAVVLKWILAIIAILVGYLAGPGNIPFLCFVALVVVVAITGAVPKVMTSIIELLSSQ